MKKILLSACVTLILGFATNTGAASPDADDLLKMARSGVDEEVLSSYIDAAPDTFDLSVEDIITLKDLGVPSKIISDALRHKHPNETDSASASVASEIIQTASNDTAAGAQPPPDILTAAAVAPAPTDQNISFFYEALYPYGNWLNIDGTWCWQPNAMVVSPDWAPYCRHGHWVDSDYGWCWVSDYSWGWAPFHYGRWFHHRTRGWCWMPDTEWGPAWVAWRMGDDYCGWAPLPPHTRYDGRAGFYFGSSLVGDDFEFNLTADDYFFVPYGNFCDRHPWGHVVPSARARDAYRNTSFVRNSYGFEGGHIVNRGLPVDRISKAMSRPVVQVAIVNDNLRPGQLIQRGLLKDNQLVMYRPAIAPATPKNPTAIKSMLVKRAASAPQQGSASGKALLNRQQAAAQQTLRDQQQRAKNAGQEKNRLEKAAAGETDSKKRADLQAEAEIQSSRAQQARAHAANIKQWRPSAQQKIAVVPRSVVVPQTSAVSRGQMQVQVRAQIQNEARMERQRQPAMDQMIRSHPAQQNSAGRSQDKKR
jgi:hypothetical protein